MNASSSLGIGRFWVCWVTVTMSIWLVAAVALGDTDVQAPEQDVALRLRPRWVEGRRTRYEGWTQRRQSMSMSFNGQNRTAETLIEVRNEMTWTVDRVKSDGSASCTVVIDWMTFSFTGADGQTQAVDSRRASGEPEMIHRLAKAIARLPVKIEMAADGSVISANGAEAIKRRMNGEGSVPDDRDFMETAHELAAIAGAPAEPQVGSKWDAAFAWRHEMGTLHQAMRYTVSSEEDVAGIPIATVTGRASLKLELDPSKLPPTGGPKLDVKLQNGSVETQIMYDIQRGEAVGRNTLQQTTIDVRIRFPNYMTMVRTINETLQSQTLRLSEE